MNGLPVTVFSSSFVLRYIDYSSMYVCMYDHTYMVITYSRAWTNRVRLPILLVVS